MKNSHQEDKNISICEHKNVKQEGGFLVCQDCGMVLDENIDFEKYNSKIMSDHYKESQLNYERTIRIKDSRAKQDPVIKQKYDRLQTIEKWYRDYQTSFTEQKKTIDFLKSYGIKIDQVKYEAIKKRYLRYNRKHRKTYQNMVVIFLAIVWMEIKDTTSFRVEEFIENCQELGHKLNKKMLNNAMLKVKKTEKIWKKFKKPEDIEREIKNRIKILLQKDLNNVSHEKVRNHIPNEQDFNSLKIEMLLLADKFLNKISYKHLKNLNYKAFTAGLIYYIGQCLDNRKIFTQALVEEATSFSSTTIRKKFHILRKILGDPENQNVQISH